MVNDPLLGQQLANFRIERVIGRGGMGQVYAGQDIKLQRPVAIKVIDTRYRGDAAYAQRFVQEARAIANWRHEHIIHIYYADDANGLYYFVMEYIDGQDLGQVLADYAKRGILMPQPEVIRLGRALGSALDYAHAKGVIHRDVKPGNVMIARDGRVVLTDFGLALDLQKGSGGDVFGTSFYIAPEQARRSANAVAQSDLYALGVLLYEMLTGVVPFDDPSPTTVAIQHITQPPPAPRQLNPDLHLETEAVLLKALSKAPQDRYQSGAALMQALEQALQRGASSMEIQRSLPRLPAGMGPSDEAVAGDSLLGRQFDAYRVDSLLGYGGMARVYRGFDVHLKRVVAIKVIDPPLRTAPDYVVRFKREAQAVGQLEHPNIVRVYQYGDTQGLLYMVMEFIDGPTLQTRIDQNERLSLAELSRLVQEIGAALDYAHAKGVIHRDVKPGNILQDRQGRTVLTDFGLALLTDVGTHGEIFGTPHYIAPEQAISSANVVPQSDLYAVGVMLYQLCTGQLPFDAADPLDIAMLHMTEPPRLPRSLRPDLSPALETVLLKALAKDPTARYPTGAALAAAFAEALQAPPAPAPAPAEPLPLARVAVAAPVVAAQGLPAIAVPVSPAAGAKPRRRRWGCLVILALLLGLGGAAYGWPPANAAVIDLWNQASTVAVAQLGLGTATPTPSNAPTVTAAPTSAPTQPSPSVASVAATRSPTRSPTPRRTVTRTVGRSATPARPINTPTVTLPVAVASAVVSATPSLATTPALTPTNGLVPSSVAGGRPATPSVTATLAVTQAARPSLTPNQTVSSARTATNGSSTVQPTASAKPNGSPTAQPAATGGTRPQAQPAFRVHVPLIRR